MCPDILPEDVDNMKKHGINWKNSLVELAVVFIGITLAFMLNNWREASNNREYEEKYLQNFSSFVEQNKNYEIYISKDSRHIFEFVDQQEDLFKAISNYLNRHYPENIS